MKSTELKRALDAAIDAARKSGALMRRNMRLSKKINEATRHDIKLELDVRSQKLIHKTLHAAFPEIEFLGEEGHCEAENADIRWVVDPIDGTVNFFHGIPHAAVSIALQVKNPSEPVTGYDTVAGVIYDPFQDELWTAVRGQKARLNGRVISVSDRTTLADCIVSTGFGKAAQSLDNGLPYFASLARGARKVRIMGAAALSLTYVASGRFDAYIERGVSLWDIAAGGLIIECAGGRFWYEQSREAGVYRMIASNGRIHDQLPPLEKTRPQKR
jgi:myo-inositol-1(or 4)-monophosphatase